MNVGVEVPAVEMRPGDFQMAATAHKTQYLCNLKHRIGVMPGAELTGNTGEYLGKPGIAAYGSVGNSLPVSSDARDNGAAIGQAASPRLSEIELV